MNRHSRKFWPPPGKEEPRISARSCDHPGCAETGEYRAPKSRHTLHDYFWFCLDHVRQYNQSWDYYAGLGQDEIEMMLRMDSTWQRPTWPMGARMGGGGFRIDPQRVKDPFGVFEEEMWQAPPPERHAPSVHEEMALKTMELTRPLTVEAVKSRYKELCKLHHPDANNGDKEAEERFKLIGQAYKTLMESLNP